MRLTIRLLGAEVFHVSTDPPDPAPDQGTTASQVEFGYTASRPHFDAPLRTDPAHEE